MTELSDMKWNWYVDKGLIENIKTFNINSTKLKKENILVPLSDLKFNLNSDCVYSSVSQLWAHTPQGGNSRMSY